jgi:hypothetical protein
MKMETSYREVSKALGQPDRTARDCKCVLSCYDKLIKSEINDKCVNKVLSENSTSQATKVISALNYCSDEDKTLYLDNEISSTGLYKRKGNVVIVGTKATDTMLDRAKRMKDDSEESLTFAMITSMFKSETKNYIESLKDYIEMVDRVSDKQYTKKEAIADITLTLSTVVNTITSLKEAIIEKSNIIMEE